MYVVNSLDNATYQVLSLFYNACRIFIPDDVDLKLGRHNEDDRLLRPCNFERNRTVRAASAADWNIWHVAFDVARHPLRGGRKLKVVGFVSNLVGGRPWSQVTCMPNLVQIVQEIKNFWGLRFPRAGQAVACGPAGSLAASAASPAPCPGCPGSRKLKVVGFVSNLVGGRSWSQVTCMPNLVQIVQEIKKNLGLCNFSPGRWGSRWRAGWRASRRARPHRPLVPGALLDKNSKLSDSSQIWWPVAHGPKWRACQVWCR